MQRYFYEVTLELWSRKKKSIFCLLNISHVPYSKLQELFNGQLTDERYLFDDSRSYQIDEQLFKIHRAYFTNHIFVDFDFKLFEYWVGLSGDKVEKLKRSHYNTWPPVEE